MFRGTRRKDVFTPFSLYTNSLSFFFCFFPPSSAFLCVCSPLALQPQNHRFVVIVPLPFSPILSLFKHTRARFERKVRISTFPPPVSLSLRLFFISSRVWGRENTFSALLNRDENFFFERELRRFDCARVGVCLLFHFLGSIFSLSLSLSCSLLNEESEIGRSRAKR